MIMKMLASPVMNYILSKDSMDKYWLTKGGREFEHMKLPRDKKGDDKFIYEFPDPLFFFLWQTNTLFKNVILVWTIF